MAEVNYIEYTTIQSKIVSWLNNEVLTSIDNFPVGYCSVDRLLEDTPSMSVSFMPKANEYMADMKGSFRKISFMLNYKDIGSTSDERLSCMKSLEYLTNYLKSLNINLGNDKIVLGLSGTLSPSILEYDETGQACVYCATYELDYKQLRRNENGY